MNKPVYQYYRIVDDRHEYLGKRYFKVDINALSIVQVVVSTGQEKKGRGHTFGVYMISKMTFFANYLAMQYAIPCTVREYTKAFKTVVKYLE